MTAGSRWSASPATRRTLADRRPCGRRECPRRGRLGRRLLVCGNQQVLVVPLGGALAPVASAVVAAGPVDQPRAVTGFVTGQRGDGYASEGSATYPHDRCAASLYPGPGLRRRHEEACFVLEDDPCSTSWPETSAQGHTSLPHRQPRRRPVPWPGGRVPGRTRRSMRGVSARPGWCRSERSVGRSPSSHVSEFIVGLRSHARPVPWPAPAQAARTAPRSVAAVTSALRPQSLGPPTAQTRRHR